MTANPMRKPNLQHGRMAGFSLIELMVALVAGLIVSGAVLAFTMSSLRANSEYVRATRLTSELRNSLSFITEDLRRAGYDENAMNYVSRPAGFAGFSPFSTILIANAGASDGCIVYAYDRLPANPGTMDLSNGEVRAIRRVLRTVNGNRIGVIEFAESFGTTTPACDDDGPNYNAYPPACNATTGWCALSDPRTIDITSLSFNKPDAGFYQNTAISPGIQLREIAVDIQGQLIGTESDTIKRGVNAVIRVRADCIRANPGSNCTAVPIP